jgi:hypothetical protein
LISAAWFRRISGMAVFVVLALSAADKYRRGVFGEELWVCPVSIALLGTGLVGGLESFFAIGFLLLLTLGVPGWLLEVASTGRTNALSVVLHFLPLLAGLIEIRRTALPRWTPLGALGIWVLLQVLALLLTEPALNVNVVFAPWEPVARFFPGIGLYRVFNAVLALIFLTGVNLALRAWQAMRVAPPAVSR